MQKRWGSNVRLAEFFYKSWFCYPSVAKFFDGKDPSLFPQSSAGSFSYIGQDRFDGAFEICDRRFEVRRGRGRPRSKGVGRFHVSHDAHAVDEITRELLVWVTQFIYM